MMLRYGKEYNKTIEGLKTEFTNEINEYIGTKLTRKDIVVKPNTKKDALSDYDIHLSIVNTNNVIPSLNIISLINKFEITNKQEKRVVKILKHYVTNNDIKFWIDNITACLICSNGWYFFEKYSHINNLIYNIVEKITNEIELNTLYIFSRFQSKVKQL